MFDLRSSIFGHSSGRGSVTFGWTEVHNPDAVERHTPFLVSFVVNVRLQHGAASMESVETYLAVASPSSKPRWAVLDHEGWHDGDSVYGFAESMGRVMPTGLTEHRAGWSSLLDLLLRERIVSGDFRVD